MGNGEKKTDAAQQQQPAVNDDDEPDEWDQRINKTGCADENMRMTDCYFATKDWRKCKPEMEAFRQCWQKHGNDSRTQSKDA